MLGSDYGALGSCRFLVKVSWFSIGEGSFCFSNRCLFAVINCGERFTPDDYVQSRIGATADRQGLTVLKLI